MLYFPLNPNLVRRRNAAKKRKLNAGDKTKSTDTEEDSAYDDDGKTEENRFLIFSEIFHFFFFQIT